MIKEELLRKKEQIESEIKRVERSNMYSQLTNSLAMLNEISQEISIMQNAINKIWKRTKQTEEEVKSIIAKYCEPSHHQKSLLEGNPFP